MSMAFMSSSAESTTSRSVGRLRERVAGFAGRRTMRGALAALPVVRVDFVRFTVMLTS
jgi:hypothetical protein